MPHPVYTKILLDGLAERGAKASFFVTGENAEKYPELCRQIDDDEQGCKTFEVRKGRFGFKLTAPYSEERCKAAGEMAKRENLRRTKR